MASISSESNGNRAIQFVAADNKRRTVRIGKASMKTAQAILVRVEALAAAAFNNTTPDRETLAWVAGCGDELAQRLAKVGLIPQRDRRTLGDFVGSYIATRSDVKDQVKYNLQVTAGLLVEYFGSDCRLSDVTAAKADAWAAAMRPRFAEATIGRHVRRARQFFRAAIRWKLLAENPFEGTKAPGQSNPARAFFITTDMVEKLLDATPSVKWRTIIALSRYGGLRIPSELSRLTWGDIDWDKNKIWITSPKTEHMTDKHGRWVPIFAELRPFLNAAFDAAEPGTVPVVPGVTDARKNLRTTLLKIIKRAGLSSWPRLFHNMRASRQTELAAVYPLHLCCAWLGNSAPIAAKHYLQATDGDFRRAAESGAVALHNPVQQPSAEKCTNQQPSTQSPSAKGFMLVGADGCEDTQRERSTRHGFEP